MSDLIRKDDVIDRIEQLRKAARGASFARVDTGYEDALDDLLDALTGWCGPGFKIPSVAAPPARVAGRGDAG